MANTSKSSRQRYREWEVDWSKRRRVGTNSQVWARNTASSQARARKWHWTTWAALRAAGVPWKPKKPFQGKHTLSSGYVVIAYRALTDEDKALIDKHGLWIGVTRGRRRGVKEHQLVALKKYGSLPRDFVVRHLDGDKTNNSPGNLVLGTQRDNRLDHRSAVVEMMRWRERALIAEGADIVASVQQ